MEIVNDKVVPLEKHRGYLSCQVEFKAGGEGPKGEFDVLAITAGVGNGWLFEPDTLRSSVDLWEEVFCYIDHEGADGRRGGKRSLRDLAGVLRNARWDAVHQGVRCDFLPIGPGGPVAADLGRDVLRTGVSKVGFSADVLFMGSHKKVYEIKRVLSVDLVLNPARGGAFLKQLDQQGGESMESEVEKQETAGEGQAALPGGSAVQQMKGDLAAMRSLLAEQSEKAQLARDVEESRQMRVQVCNYLLGTALAASKLPTAAQDQVRKQFEGRVFESAELEQALADTRQLVADLTAGVALQGPGRVHAVYSSDDRLQAAVDDLLGAPRDPAMQGVKVERLQGIRELYLMLTGDDDLHGGFDRERVRLATTADFSGLVKNALNKVVVDKWDELGRAGYNWWEKIVTVEHAVSLNDLTGILVGTVGSLPAVQEGAEYTELPVGDSSETASFTKYGGYIPLTLELIDRDETRKLREYPRALAAAGLRKISSLVAAIFTANNGAGPLMADGGELFNSTAVTTAGGHANLRTTALGAAEWDVVQTAVFKQPMLVKNENGTRGMGPAMGVNPRYLLVPRALQLTAMKILYPSLENAANIYSQNQQRGQPGDVITVPEWTDSTDWAAACDPVIAPAIYIGERFGLRPEIYIAGSELSPAVFMNDEHRLKVRHFLAVMVADYRPLHKSNVAG